MASPRRRQARPLPKITLDQVLEHQFYAQAYFYELGMTPEGANELAAAFYKNNNSPYQRAQQLGVLVRSKVGELNDALVDLEERIRVHVEGRERFELVGDQVQEYLRSITTVVDGVPQATTAVVDE